MKELNIASPHGISRRGVLKISAGGATAVAFGGAMLPSAALASGTVRWVSPRGTVEGVCLMILVSHC